MKFLIPSAFFVSIAAGSVLVIKVLAAFVMSLVLFVSAESAETLYEVSVRKFFVGTEEALKKGSRPFLIVDANGEMHYNDAFAEVASIHVVH